MFKDLDERGSQTEKKTGDLNVNIENVQMNVAMQHRTVIAMAEDRKSVD